MALRETLSVPVDYLHHLREAEPALRSCLGKGAQISAFDVLDLFLSIEDHMVSVPPFSIFLWHFTNHSLCHSIIILKPSGIPSSLLKGFISAIPWQT